MHWEQIGLDEGVRAVVRDLYAERDLGEFTGSFTASVGVHDVAALRITPLGVQGSLTWRPWHAQPMFAAYPKDARLSPPADAELAPDARRRRAVHKGTPSEALALAPDL